MAQAGLDDYDDAWEGDADDPAQPPREESQQQGQALELQQEQQQPQLQAEFGEMEMEPAQGDGLATLRFDEEPGRKEEIDLDGQSQPDGRGSGNTAAFLEAAMMPDVQPEYVGMDFGANETQPMGLQEPMAWAGSGWDFVPFLESPGHDMLLLGEGLSSAELKHECLRLASQGAVAVTTNGVVKSGLEPRDRWQMFSDDPLHGTWIAPQIPAEPDVTGVAISLNLGPGCDWGDDDDCSAASKVGPLEMKEGGYMSVGSNRSHRSARPARAAEVAANKNRWEQKTVDRLNHARDLTRQAVKNIIDSNNAHSFASKLGGDLSVSHTIKKKIGKTNDLCKLVEDRIESLEDTIRQVGECLFRLQRAHRVRWAPLNVCERRLELREGRPIQELVRDDCQVALENERSLLVNARGALEQQIDAVKEAIVGLDRYHGMLREDLQQKRHALRIDRSCLSPKKPAATNGHFRGSARGSGTGGSQADRLVLPMLQDVMHYGMPPSPKEAEAGSGGWHEGRRENDTVELVNRVARAEEDAVQVSKSSDALIVDVEQKCAAASQQANVELGRRLQETQNLKRQLEVQLAETDEAIVHTELTLSKTKQALDSHDKPLRALDAQFAARSLRPEREGIRDPVHDEMEGHLEHLKKSVRNLTGKIQASKELLEQLRAAKTHLQEDYRNKSLAQKIDDACMKVTARKAMELDRKDPRGGRCQGRELPRRRARAVPPLTNLETSALTGGFTW